MNVHDIDLNLLRVFDAVLHEKGVTPAAARLGLTQPAVSNALARLRKLLGDALFVRTPRGMDATPFARELAEPVRQALALLESALAHGPGFDPATATRAFRFYMSDLGQIEFLPPLVERVQRDAPGVRLEAVALEVEDIADALAAGALDLAVGFLPGLGAPVRRQALFKDPYLCLMRADHPIATLTQEALPRSVARAGHLPRRPPRDRGGARARRPRARASRCACRTSPWCRWCSSAPTSSSRCRRAWRACSSGAASSRRCRRRCRSRRPKSRCTGTSASRPTRATAGCARSMVELLSD